MLPSVDLRQALLLLRHLALRPVSRIGERSLPERRTCIFHVRDDGMLAGTRRGWTGTQWTWTLSADTLAISPRSRATMKCEGICQPHAHSVSSIADRAIPLVGQLLLIV